MDRLAGRGIIVTGATGIAAASARRFAAEGARVMVISRTEARCEALVDEITAAAGWAYPWRPTSPTSRRPRRPWSTPSACSSRVDGLFNVAGGSGRRLGDGPLHELTPEAYEATMRLNATTHVTVTAPVLRAMLEQEPDADGQRGAIVNMGSVLATQPVPELFATHAYASAKGADRGADGDVGGLLRDAGHPHQHGGAGADHLAHVAARRRPTRPRRPSRGASSRSPTASSRPRTWPMRRCTFSPPSHARSPARPSPSTAAGRSLPIGALDAARTSRQPQPQEDDDGRSRISPPP